MATIAQNLATSSSSNYTRREPTKTWSLAETFTPLITGNIDSVKIRIAKFDAGSNGSFTVSIRATSAGEPTAGISSDLWSQAFDSDALSESPTFVEFTGMSIPVVEDVLMAVVLRPTVMEGAPYLVPLNFHKTTNSSYADGQAFSSGGVTDDFNTDNWAAFSSAHDYSFQISGSLAGPSIPTLSSPSNGASNQGINGDWLKELIYDDNDAESFGSYTVHFSIDDGSSFIPQDDRSRYSIITYKMFLGFTLEYDTTYYWFVRKIIEDVETDSDIWSFSTISLQPPVPSTHPVSGLLTGNNGMVTIRRLVACSNNKVFYET
jgi:hypothetical protein